MASFDELLYIIGCFLFMAAFLFFFAWVMDKERDSRLDKEQNRRNKRT